MFCFTTVLSSKDYDPAQKLLLKLCDLCFLISYQFEAFDCLRKLLGGNESVCMHTHPPDANRLANRSGHGLD